MNSIKYKGRVHRLRIPIYGAFRAATQAADGGCRHRRLVSCLVKGEDATESHECEGAYVN